MRLSSDGNILAVGWSEAVDLTVTGGIMLWDAQAGKKLLKLDKDMIVCGLSFSSDNKYLVLGCFYSTLDVCEVKTGRSVHVKNDLEKLTALMPIGTDGRFATLEKMKLQLWSLDKTLKPKRMESPPFATSCDEFAFTADGRTLVMAANRGELLELLPEKPALIDLWDVDRKKRIKQFSGMDENNITSMQLSPDGKQLAIGYIFGSENLEICAAETGKFLFSLSGHPLLVRSLVFSQDKKYLFSGDYAGTMIVWDLDSKGEKKRVVRAHLQSVEYLALSPDGSRLYSGSYDHSVKIWNVKDLLPK
jgi:WD40 repeat protein